MDEENTMEKASLSGVNETSSVPANRPEKKSHAIAANVVSSSDSDSDFEYECTLCNVAFPNYTSLKQHEKGKRHDKNKRLHRDPRSILEDESGEDDVLDQLQKPFAVCELCKKEFSGPKNYRQHLKSKYHKKKKMEASILEKIKVQGEIDVTALKKIFEDKAVVKDRAAAVEGPAAVVSEDDELVAEESEEYECKECEKVFSGLKPFAQHVVSKAHLKKMKQKKMIRELREKGSLLGGMSGKDLSALAESEGVMTCVLCTAAFSGPESALMHLKSKGHAKKLEKSLRRMKKMEKSLAGEGEAAESDKNDTETLLGALAEDSSDKSQDEDHPQRLERKSTAV